MKQQESEDYYLSHKPEILSQFDTYARAWKSYLTTSYGQGYAEVVLKDARE